MRALSAVASWFAFFTLLGRPAFGCPVCMGKQTGPLAEATNAAIFLMLGVLFSVFVLLGMGARLILSKEKALGSIKVKV